MHDPLPVTPNTHLHRYSYLKRATRVFFLCLMAACARPHSQLGEPFNLEIEVKLPNVLTRHRQRLERFYHRAVGLRLTVGKAPHQESTFYEPSQWKVLHLVIPESAKKETHIALTATIWDKERNSALRTYPALIGYSQIQNQPTPQTATLTMKLLVPADEYD